jgi:uracil-DNA glycosylase
MSQEIAAERRRPDLEPTWLAALEGEFAQPYMDALRAFLGEEKKQHAVFPPNADLFNAFRYTPLPAVRVVVLGQDPYHGPGQAHGLCFSVRRGVPPPPSLVNIFKELERELGIPRPAHGELTHWAKQGVLLLNTVLTVRSGQPQSHAGKGWERFTDRVIQVLNAEREGLVFVLWGAPAGKKAAMIDGRKHLVLRSPHPSPLSADRGFFGCGHFARINQHLIARGELPIDWSLPD